MLGYVIKYFCLLPDTNGSNTVYYTTDKLIPTNIVDLNASKYAQRIIYHRLSNKILILFNNSVIGYSSDYTLNFEGFYKIGIGASWKDMDLSVSDDSADLISVFVLSVVTIINITNKDANNSWREFSWVDISPHFIESVMIADSQLLMTTYNYTMTSNITRNIEQYDFAISQNPNGSYSSILMQCLVTPILTINLNIY